MITSSDVYLTEQGERIDVDASTEAGTGFVDAWLGALLEVIDSGRIVIPREAKSEFIHAAAERGLSVVSDET